MITSEIKIDIINNKIDIFNAIYSLKENLYNQVLNEKNIILQLSEKYAKNAEFLVEKLNNEPIGLCAFYANDAETKIAYLSMILIDKKYRGLGCAHMLIEEMISICKSNNMKKIRLEVDNSNENAKSIYFRWGFIVEKQERDSSFLIYKIREDGKEGEFVMLH